MSPQVAGFVAKVPREKEPGCVSEIPAFVSGFHNIPPRKSKFSPEVNRSDAAS
jgi:hypothetical protein